jgi:hypothetical protein
MTTQLPSKIRLAQIASFTKSMVLPPSHDEIEALALFALAAYEQEPVAVVELSDYGTAAQLSGDEPRKKAVKELYEGALVVGQTLYAHPAPSIHIDENSDFIKHIRKCSEEVSKWPEWKRNAADAMSAIDAPSIPAVPDSIQMRKALVWLDEVIQSNPGMKEPVTCRAAMLNGGKS